MKSTIFSHIGKRKINEDFVLVQNINPETYIYIIADGMGGYKHGEIAAKIVAKNILTFLSTIEIINEVQIQKAINKANLAIRQLGQNNNTKVGATVGGIILQGNQAICFWVGDVKIFYYKNNILVKESNSHTLMNEIISNGSIKDVKQVSKYKHVVTRSVQGELDKSQMDYFIINDVSNDDLIMICSDGVTDIFNGLKIQSYLAEGISVKDLASKIEKILGDQAFDNYSGIFIDC